MITLITGTPGAGKTLYTVAELLRGYEKAGRPIYVLGIPDLKIEHLPMPPLGEWTEQREVKGWEEGADNVGSTQPFYRFPENAVIVIDEAQSVFRPRASTSKIPDHVAALETHRHTGIDFLLITQHPSRIDNSVRTLVGRHLHVRRVWGLNRAIIYEWDGASDPNRTSAATKKTWGYPKKAFDLYKSAEVHTSRGQRIPLMAWIFLGIMISLPLALWGGYKGVRKVTHTDGQPVSVPTTPGINTAQPIPPAEKTAPDIERVAWSPEDHQPRDPNRPESAPIYDETREIKTMPVLAGCIQSRKQCRCYDQQGHRIETAERDYCAAWVEKGGQFNPYAEPAQQDRYGQPSGYEKRPDTTLSEWKPRDAGDTVSFPGPQDHLAQAAHSFGTP